MISGITFRYSLRDVTVRPSVSSTRPLMLTVPHFSSARSSTTQENGTDMVKLRSPSTSSEVYSTVTFTLPETVQRLSESSFSRMVSWPAVSTIRAMSGQYSGIAVSSASSWAAVMPPVAS